MSPFTSKNMNQVPFFWSVIRSLWFQSSVLEVIMKENYSVVAFESGNILLTLSLCIENILFSHTIYPNLSFHFLKVIS